VSEVSARVHADCIKLRAAGRGLRAPTHAGVLILGPSGAGKSDLALRLIASGAVLVASDQTDLFVKGRKLCARAPRRLRGLIEVRGLGVIDIPYAESTSLSLVVQLADRAERMPAAERYAPPSSLRLPKAEWPPLIRLVGHEASAAAKITAAVGAFARGALRENVKRD